MYDISAQLMRNSAKNLSGKMMFIVFPYCQIIILLLIKMIISVILIESLVTGNNTIMKLSLSDFGCLTTYFYHSIVLL